MWLKLLCIRLATTVEVWKHGKDDVICEVVLVDGKVQPYVNLSPVLPVTPIIGDGVCHKKENCLPP